MPKQHPRELRERAVRLVAEHRGEHETEYAAIPLDSGESWASPCRSRCARAAGKYIAIVPLPGQRREQRQLG